MKYFLSVLCVLIQMAAMAQAAHSQVEMADQFRAEGKIYVVVATIALIMAGLFAFLLWIERRLAFLEKQQKI